MMRATLLVLLMAVPAYGTVFTIDLRGDYDTVATAIVDSETDTLTWTSWTESPPEFIDPFTGELRDPLYLDPTGQTWNATTDVPDDWDGTTGGVWGFLSPDLVISTAFSVSYAGLGMKADTSIDFTFARYEDSLNVMPAWYYFQQYDIGWEAMYSRRTFQRIDVQPVMPGRIVGDVNLDGVFESDDLVSVFSAGLYETGEYASWPDGDWTGDGLFNSRDMVLAFQEGAYERGGEAASVPEPTAMILLLLGYFVLMIRR